MCYRDEIDQRRMPTIHIQLCKFLLLAVTALWSIVSNAASLSSCPTKKPFLINFNHNIPNFVSFQCPCRQQISQNFYRAWKIFQVAHFAQKKFDSGFDWIFSCECDDQQKGSLLSLGINERSPQFDYGQDNVCSKEACRCLHSSGSHKTFHGWWRRKTLVRALYKEAHSTAFYNCNNSFHFSDISHHSSALGYDYLKFM